MSVEVCKNIHVTTNDSPQFARKYGFVKTAIY